MIPQDMPVVCGAFRPSSAQQIFKGTIQHFRHVCLLTSFMSGNILVNSDGRWVCSHRQTDRQIIDLQDKFYELLTKTQTSGPSGVARRHSTLWFTQTSGLDYLVHVSYLHNNILFFSTEVTTLLFWNSGILWASMERFLYWLQIQTYLSTCWTFPSKESRHRNYIFRTKSNLVFRNQQKWLWPLNA